MSLNLVSCLTDDDSCHHGRFKYAYGCCCTLLGLYILLIILSRNAKFIRLIFDDHDGGGIWIELIEVIDALPTRVYMYMHMHMYS